MLIIDEDLAGMYLTEKSRGKQRDVDQHDEVELLLEAYVKQVDGIVQEADQLASNMRNTEEIVNIILDANRNSLMLLDLKVLTLLLLNKRLIVGIDDDAGNWFRCCYRWTIRNEFEKFHGGLGIWIPGYNIPCIRDDYVSLWIWPHEIKKNTEVDFVWSVSRS